MQLNHQENEDECLNLIEQNQTDSAELLTNRSSIKNPLDEFEGLWEVTEDQIPTSENLQTQTPTSNLEEALHQQSEEILYLKEVNSLLLSEKEELLAEVTNLSSIADQYSEIQRDYESVTSLNRKLTKQINEINRTRQIELTKLKAICKILEG